jgi:hypothetical protein
MSAEGMHCDGCRICQLLFKNTIQSLDVPNSIRRRAAAAGACTAQQLLVHCGGKGTCVPHPILRLQEVMRLHCFSIEPQPGPAGAEIVIMELNS